MTPSNEITTYNPSQLLYALGISDTCSLERIPHQLHIHLPESNVADYDCFIHIVFKDVQDFINVKNDLYYKQVVVPDHGKFADHKTTTVVTGWFERHITEGQAVAFEGGTKANGVNGH